MTSTNCGLPDGHMHMHSERCYLAGVRDGRRAVSAESVEVIAAIEALVAAAEQREATSLSRTFDGGSFGAWVDAKELRAALTVSPASAVTS